MSVEDVKKYLRGETSRADKRHPKDMKGGDHKDEAEVINKRRLAEYEQLEKKPTVLDSLEIPMNEDSGEQKRKKSSIEGRKAILEKLIAEQNR